MNNQLAQLPPSEIISIGNLFAQSGMFPDIKSAAQAIVKIQAGQELGIGPFAAMSGIHIIQGKVTIGAGIMASRIKASSKYDYNVLELNDTACRLQFFENEKSVGVAEFTIADARRAGTKNLDRFPKNMLFARAISNGVKSYAPDVFDGPVYTPEEFDQKTDDVAAEVTTNKDTFAESLKARVEPALMELTPQHPDYPKCVEFMKTGGTVDRLRARYNISSMMAGDLNSAAPKQTQTTQAAIQQANANYVPPTTPAAAPAEEIDASCPF